MTRRLFLLLSTLPLVKHKTRPGKPRITVTLRSH